MRIFTVYINLHSKSKEKQPIFVEEGFSFWAFVFGFICALYHRCWFLGAALFTVEVVLHGLLRVLESDFLTVAICQIGLSILIGFQFNDWRRAALSRADWIVDSLVAAVDSDTAFLRWMESKTPSFVRGQLPSAVEHSGNEL